MKRQKIGVDIDDVLAASAEGFAAFSNKQWGTNLTAADYAEEWAPLWGVSVEEAIKRADELHAQGAHRDYSPFAEAFQVLGVLRERYELEVVTSRRVSVKGVTQEWLDRYFPGIFQGVHYVGMWDDSHPANIQHRLQQTKGALCRAIGADYLIDDQLKHCVAAAEAGVQALLFGDYSWNRTANDLPNGVTRTHTWQEVKEFFDAQS
jgi:uncharacterized HAD superfamily protein